MPGRPNKGAWRGRKPAGSKDFVKGEKRTIDAAHKGGQARKAQFARFKSMREAAEALRDMPAFVKKGFSDMTNGVAAVASMYKESQLGNPKAFHELTALMGELIEKVDVQNLPVLRDDIPRAPDPVPQQADDKTNDKGADA